MKFLNKLFLGLLTVISLTGLSYAINCGGGSVAVERFTVSGAEVWCLDQSGNIGSTGTIVVGGNVRAHTGQGLFGTGVKLGNDLTTPSAPTAGASGTGMNFGFKVPYVNMGEGTISAGAIVVTSSSAASAVLAPGTVATVLSTTSWLGINESSLAKNATGYLVVAGYALALTTGTVNYGDLIVTTTTTAGYGGAIAAANTVFEGAVVGKAMSIGTTTGGLTLIRIGN